MEDAILSFVDCLRHNGVRVSTAEAVDAMRCAAVPGILGHRGRLRAALKAALISRGRDVATFDSLFELYFAMNPITNGTNRVDRYLRTLEDAGTDNTAIANSDYDLADFALVDATCGTPQISSSPSAEADMSEYFDPNALRNANNLDNDADIVNLASMTDEISFSPSGGKANARGMKVQLDVSQTHSATPGSLTPSAGQAVELSLTEDEEKTLLSWLGATSTTDSIADTGDIAGLLAKLPEYPVEHLRQLAELQRTITTPDAAGPVILDEVSEVERTRFEESLRALAKSLRGGLAQRRRVSPRGRVHSALTTRRSLRYDGVPFRPVTVQRTHERSQVIVLADVSLSVRATARFTLRMVHSMHHIFGHARTFAFVHELAEVTNLFDQHPLEHALGLVFSGQVIDTDASSDYGAVFTQLLAEAGNALNNRTSLVIIGDGRSNGNDPELETFSDIARRVRRIVWLTPEPSYSWHLGSCALPTYAPECERVEVVTDLSGLERATAKITTASSAHS